LNWPAPEEFGRHSIRLKGYDYSQAGAYFVTIVSYGRECLFGEVVEGVMRVNALGRIVQESWDEISVHFPNTQVDTFITMPNHVHGIVLIFDDIRRGTIYRAPTTLTLTQQIEKFGKPTIGSLPTIIRTFKGSVTRCAGRDLTSRAGIQPASAVSGSREHNNSGNIWQRNYLSRGFCGATNILSATRPITSASPVTSSITRSTGTRTMKIPKTPVTSRTVRKPPSSAALILAGEQNV